MVCTLNPIEYAMEGSHTGRMSDLVALTGERRHDLFDAFYRGPVLRALEAEAPDAVGITLTNRQQWVAGLTLARLLKARGFHVVLGGALVSKFVDTIPPEFFRIFADTVVAYEGEAALLALLGELEGGHEFARVPNLVWLDRGSVRRNPPRVENVNELPTPDFEGLPLERYLAPSPVLPILTGKGCYFNRCRFCDIPFINHVSSKAYRVRHPELVVGDVRTLAARHGARHFVITDEALSPKLLLKLADAFEPFAREERHFTGYARLERGFTRPVLDRIAAMGMRKLFFGLESASQRMIDHMDKGTDVSIAPRILRDCRDAGIRFHLFGIVGLPEETEALARATYRFFLDHRDILDVPGNSFGIKPFSLELRTAYFENRDRYGIELTDDALDGEFLVGLGPDQWRNTRGLTHEETRRLLDEEFNPGIVRTFGHMYGGRFQIWPVGEEHAVQYGGRYLHSVFPFRAALPAIESDEPLTLRVNPAARIRAVGLSLEITSLGQQLVLPRPAMEMVTAPRPRRVRELLEQLNEEDDEAVHATLASLVSAGVLQLKLEASQGASA